MPSETDGRWRPARGAKVRCTGPAKAPEDAPAPPGGRWMLLDRSPTGPRWWWLQAVDDVARAWCAAHPAESQQSCIERSAQHFEPVNRTLAR